MAATSRIDGYAAIGDYAVIGDGRTAALIATDGSIDWLCLPNLDSPSVFAAILDARRGGAFALQPAVPFTASRRYLPDTNVLETTFHTDRGVVRVVDALTIPDGGLPPMRELVRAIDGVAGTVPMSWRFAPRFEYGSRAATFQWRGRVPIAISASEAIAVCHWGAGLPARVDDALESRFEMAAGQRAILALSSAYSEPLVLPSRDDVELRLRETIRFWERWARARTYGGSWIAAVRRSALALKLLIFSPSGAVAAAPTTSLPEEIGGARNWDYRFCWIRDSNFTISALIELGCYDEAKALFWWFMQATALTEPELKVLYRLDGGSGASERELPLAGYRGSRPVRLGNSAVVQTQLDMYGELLETAWLYSSGHHALDADTGAVLARIADRVCGIWREPDAGIWEVRNGPFHFTHSKVMCWVALDRAIRLADRRELPVRHVDRWRREAAAIEHFVEHECWSDQLSSYTRAADAGGHDRVDASLLMLPLVGYGRSRPDRISATIDAISRELRSGDFVYRYRADDGLAGAEGCFLNCSFWMVGALARVGRLDEASALMESLLARANDVGLFAEEVDPATGEFLGNFPQALVHLSLIDAAIAIDAATERRKSA
jgi:GH15 family glucan-1,4-alpha-glucosidase